MSQTTSGSLGKLPQSNRRENVKAWYGKREILTEFFAEFGGTFFLVLFGNGSIASGIFSKEREVNVVAASVGWGFAILISLTIAMPLSGGHLNPAVTIALMSIDKFPPYKVFHYIAGQTIGAFTASAVLYVNYNRAIKVLPKATSYEDSLLVIAFTTRPKKHLQLTSIFLDNFITAGAMMFTMLIITLKNGLMIPKYLIPVYIGSFVAAIILSLGGNCGAPLNPARDLMPRLFLRIFRPWEEEYFVDYYWFIGPILATIVGAAAGAHLYIYTLENTSIHNHAEINVPNIIPPSEHAKELAQLAEAEKFKSETSSL